MVSNAPNVTFAVPRKQGVKWAVIAGGGRVAKQTEHGKIIASAAKAALVPLGCRRIGQSRLWVSDERSWVIVVEFQPSSFSRGSYLNVSPMWLWRDTEKAVWSFDYGRARVASYVEFQNRDQFTAEASLLARRAAEEIKTLRQLLNSPPAIARCLMEAADTGSLWTCYHAAVAAGLLGNTETSLRLFTSVILHKPENAVDWILKLQNRCADLASKLRDPPSFREAIDGIVQRKRACHKLRDDPDCLQSWYR
jgi:hypothetical protein